MELEFDGAAFAEAVVFSKHEIEGEGELIPAGIKNVGKKQEREDFTCTLTEQDLIAAGWPAGNEGFYYREKRHAIYQRAVQTLLDEVKPGWEAGGYFGSKDSVGTERDGRIPVKCSIYRYVSP